MIGTALIETWIDADVCSTALIARPHAADWRSEMLLNPFLALEERTLGSWPTSALFVADDVVADADNLVLLKTRFEKVDGRQLRLWLRQWLNFLYDELARC